MRTIGFVPAIGSGESGRTNLEPCTKIRKGSSHAGRVARMANINLMTPIKPATGPGNNLLRGTAWMIAARWVTRCIGLVSMVILARLLAPEDYGLMAMAMLAYGLLETIAMAYLATMPA